MDEQQTSPTYQKGFNDGYIMTEHVPDLADQLAEVKSDSDRMDGFRNGRKQFVLDQTKEYRPNWLSRDRHDIKDQDAQDRDIDHDI